MLYRLWLVFVLSWTPRAFLRSINAGYQLFCWSRLETTLAVLFQLCISKYPSLIRFLIVFYTNERPFVSINVLLKSGTPRSSIINIKLAVAIKPVNQLPWQLEMTIAFVSNFNHQIISPVTGYSMQTKINRALYVQSLRIIYLIYTTDRCAVH